MANPTVSTGESYLSVDLGTTAIKIVWFDEHGEILGQSTREYRLQTPRENIVEIEPESYWNNMREGIREVLNRPGIDAASIRSLSISSQGETLIPVDATGKPLRNAIVWLDNRSFREAEEIRENLGLNRRTGQTEVLATWPATKILWLRKNEGDVFDKTAKYLLAEDYLIHRLTGEFQGEYSLYSSSYLLDIVDKTWDRNILDFIGIGPEKLVKLGESGGTVGKIRPAVADELGLSRELQVVLGAMDQVAALLGAGTVRGGITTETTGAALAICRTMEDFPDDPPESLAVHYHAVPDAYLYMGWCPTGGLSLKWLRDGFFSGESYRHLDEIAEKIPAGSQGLFFYPYLSGPGTLPVDPDLRGVFFGLELHHTRDHLVRAVLESVAYVIRENIEWMRTSSGSENLYSLGGGSRSPLWTRIKADVTNQTVRTVRCSEASSLGVAMLQATATGRYADLAAAAEGMVRYDSTIEPDPEGTRVYDERYRSYIRVRDSYMKMNEGG